MSDNIVAGNKFAFGEPLSASVGVNFNLTVAMPDAYSLTGKWATLTVSKFEDGPELFKLSEAGGGLTFNGQNIPVVINNDATNETAGGDDWHTLIQTYRNLRFSLDVGDDGDTSHAEYRFQGDITTDPQRGTLSDGLEVGETVTPTLGGTTVSVSLLGQQAGGGGANDGDDTDITGLLYGDGASLSAATASQARQAAELDTTDSPTFDNLTLSNGLNLSDGSQVVVGGGAGTSTLSGQFTVNDGAFTNGWIRMRAVANNSPQIDLQTGFITRRSSGGLSVGDSVGGVNSMLNVQGNLIINGFDNRLQLGSGDATGEIATSFGGATTLTMHNIGGGTFELDVDGDVLADNLTLDGDILSSTGINLAPNGTNPATDSIEFAHSGAYFTMNMLGNGLYFRTNNLVRGTLSESGTLQWRHDILGYDGTQNIGDDTTGRFDTVYADTVDLTGDITLPSSNVFSVNGAGRVQLTDLGGTMVEFSNSYFTGFNGGIRLGATAGDITTDVQIARNSANEIRFVQSDGTTRCDLLADNLTLDGDIALTSAAEINIGDETDVAYVNGRLICQHPANSWAINARINETWGTAYNCKISAMGGTYSSARFYSGGITYNHQYDSYDFSFRWQQNGSDRLRIESGGIVVGGGITASGDIDFTGLPTSDPAVAGRLWNDSGTLKISAG